MVRMLYRIQKMIKHHKKTVSDILSGGDIMRRLLFIVQGVTGVQCEYTVRMLFTSQTKSLGALVEVM